MTILHRSAFVVRSSLLALGLVGFTAPAWAQDATAAVSDATKAACGTGFEQSQLLRREGKLQGARAELLKCAQDACSRAVREQCGVWLEEVERATPTIIVQATLDGEDHTEVQVELDGKLLTESTVGMSYDADPGVHKVRFTTAGLPPIEKTVVLREGEKLRTIQVAFQSPKAAPVAVTPPPVVAPAPASVPPPRPVEMERPVPALTYVFAGLAVAGGGAFAYFGLTGNNRLQELEGECAPNCAKGDVDPVQQKLLIANISAAAGAVGLVGAVVTYLARPSRPVQMGALRPNVALGPRGVGTSLSFDF